MSYNEDDEGWQTVGGRDEARNRYRRNDGEGRRSGGERDDDRSSFRRNENDERRENEWSGGRNDYEAPSRRGRRQEYQSGEKEWPSLGEGEAQHERRPGRADATSAWRPNLHSHTDQHKEELDSSFSVRGFFSTLKKTVKAKVRKVLSEVSEDTRSNFKLPASEQHYAEAVGADVDCDPTNEELADVIAACARLWDLDINRLTPGDDYEIDCGEGKKMYQKEDMEENALFRRLDPSVFQRPTYARFIALLDNYNASMSETERVTRQEEQEELAFIEEISRTAPIQYLFKYLQAKSIIQGGEEQFKKALHNLWFKMVDRCGADDSSSAFEHVFVGEIKRKGNQVGEVSGLHNWIQFYLEEAEGSLDYQGFILPRRRGSSLPDNQSQVLSVQFMWNGLLKPLSTTLIGVSPEFEVALYTLCFYCGGEDNHVELGPYSVNIKVYPLGRGIGSAFSIAEE